MSFNLHKWLKEAIINDGFDKDITSSAIINPKIEASGSFVAKKQGIVCGTKVVQELYHIIIPQIEVNLLKEDGEYLNRGDAIISIKGKLLDIIKGQRLAENILDAMSALSFALYKYSRELAGTKCVVVPNYKALPNFGGLTKEAVFYGSGIWLNKASNDYGLIDELHIKSLGGNLSDAVSLFRKNYPDKELEVVVSDIDQYLEALDLAVNRITLNNISFSDIQKIFKNKPTFPSIGYSGNVSIGNILEIANLGFDYIIVDDLANLIKPVGIYLKIYKRNFK